MKYGIAAVTACLLAGCQTGADLVQPSVFSGDAAAQYNLSGREIAAMKAGLKAELDDVSNARKDEPPRWFCGEHRPDREAPMVQ